MERGCVGLREVGDQSGLVFASSADAQIEACGTHGHGLSFISSSLLGGILGDQ